MSQTEVTICDNCGARVERQERWGSTPPRWWNINVFKGHEPEGDPSELSSGWYADYCSTCTPDLATALDHFATKYRRGFE